MLTPNNRPLLTNMPPKRAGDQESPMAMVNNKSGGSQFNHHVDNASDGQVFRPIVFRDPDLAGHSRAERR